MTTHERYDKFKKEAPLRFAVIYIRFVIAWVLFHVGDFFSFTFSNWLYDIADALEDCNVD